MADITEIKLPDATVFTVKDPSAQPKTLATPLDINGNTESTVEDALDGLNDYSDALKGNLDDNFSGQSNENLLDNGWFTVNQRGFASAIFQTGNVYTADRWLIIGSTIGGSASLSSSGMKLSRTGESTSGYLTQFLESLTLGKPYTLSVLFDNGTIESKTGIINSTADSISFSFANGLGSTRLYYFSGGSKWTVDVIVFAGSEFTIRAVKLELGSVSTLANDVEPNYTTELLKCQRYLAPVGYCTVIKNSSGTYSGVVHLPVPMRGAPNIPLPALSNALWAPGLGTFTPDTVSFAIQDTYVNSIVAVFFTGASLTEDFYIYDGKALASAEL